MLRFMIERHYGQRQIAEGFFNEPIRGLVGTVEPAVENGANTRFAADVHP
jgi:hypothetical protein